MDQYLSALRSQLAMCEKLLVERTKKVARDPQGLSTYNARLTHTLAMYHLVQELRGMVEQDPDLWEDEPDIVPF